MYSREQDDRENKDKAWGLERYMDIFLVPKPLSLIKKINYLHYTLFSFLIYLAASGLSCGMLDLHCIIQDLSL